MNYIVTARKWRPKIFDEVVGQQHITQTLKNAIKNNRVAHAFIFAGPRGVGKTTTARILAKRLNCLNPIDGEPCNQCDMCRSFMESQSLDIIEIDGASNRRIEEIRTLRESVKYAPTRGSYKIYIIDEVHMLTTESFNALLKTLEEPPEHTIFIFATTDVHKVPLTIISRCQRFDFRRIEMEEIKSLLKKIADSESITINDEALTIIAKKADGALRDAQSLFDQVISFCGNDITESGLSLMLNIINDDIYFQVSDAILDKNFGAAFDVTSRLYSNGWNYTDFLNGLTEHFRNILTVIITNDNKLIESSSEIKKKYLKYIGNFSESDLLRMLNFLSKTQYELKSVQNHKLKIEIALSQLIGLEKTSTISELLKTVSELDTSSGEDSDYNKKKTLILSYEKEELKEKTPAPLSEKELVNKPSNEDISIYPEKESESLNQPQPISEIKQPNVTTNEIIDTEGISEKKVDWKSFTEKMLSQSLLRGSHLDGTELIETKDNILVVGHPNKDDIKILNDNIAYYKQEADKYFNFSYSLEFIHKPELSKDNTLAETITNIDEISELGKNVMEFLGGKLLK